jgi:hypothetical protein
MNGHVPKKPVFMSPTVSQSFKSQTQPSSVLTQSMQSNSFTTQQEGGCHSSSKLAPLSISNQELFHQQ